MFRQVLHVKGTSGHTEQQRAHPDSEHIIIDFKEANLKTVLTKFSQKHVKCTTGGANTLDHMSSNIKHAYRAIKTPSSPSTITLLWKDWSYSTSRTTSSTFNPHQVI